MKKIAVLVCVCGVIGFYQSAHAAMWQPTCDTVIPNGERCYDICKKCISVGIPVGCCTVAKEEYGCRCNAGYRSTGDTANCNCVPCGFGYYSAGGSFGLVCTPCKIGFFNSESAASSCKSCVSATGNLNATTSGTGSRSISDCHLPAGTVGSDSSGSFEYSSNCQYL